MAAPFAALLRWRDMAWGLAMLATGAAFVISLALFVQVSANGTIVYDLGGWPAPIGIVYVIDAAISGARTCKTGKCCIMTRHPPPHRRASQSARHLQLSRNSLEYG